MDTKSQEIEEAMNSKVRTIVVDLDGTLAEFDHWRGYNHIGNPIPKIVEYVRKKHQEGWEVVIHTCRITTLDNKVHIESLRRVEWFLVKNHIPYNEIWMGTGKPYGEIYLDDHAVNIKDI